jgi:hypothetical protein
MVMGPGLTELLTGKTDSQLYEEKRVELRTEYIQSQMVELFGVKDPVDRIREQSTANGPSDFWDHTLSCSIPKDGLITRDEVLPLLSSFGKEKRLEPDGALDHIFFSLVREAKATVVYLTGPCYLIRCRDDLIHAFYGSDQTMHVDQLSFSSMREWTEPVLRSLLLSWKHSEQPERSKGARDKLCELMLKCATTAWNEAHDRFNAATFVVKMDDEISLYRPDAIVAFTEFSPPTHLADSHRRVRQSTRLLVSNGFGVVIPVDEPSVLEFVQGHTTTFWSGMKSNLLRHVNDVRKQGSDQALFLTVSKHLILVTHRNYLCTTK